MNSTLAKLLAAAAFIALPLAASAQDKVVNVYNWSDYVGEGVLDDFTKETGIKVVYDVYDSMEMMETKLLAGGSGYDVIVPTDRNLARLIQAGVVQKLDKSKIPNVQYQWKEIAGPARDLRSRPRARRQLHVGHDRHRLQRRQDQGAHARRAGQFLGDDLRSGGDLALRRLRHPGARLRRRHDSRGAQLSRPPPGLEELGGPAEGRRPPEERSARISRNSTPPNTSTRSPTATSAWRSAIRATCCRRATARRRPTTASTSQYSIPKEGALMWLDSFAIPADAPHPDNATPSSTSC